ncbi:ABC transporter permease [Halorarius halobius]|uniref:ABC transporter permease n=1 Tax=Halorarius halobius TaxID=2962671 RepID=UPI0020CC19C1|nr:ABC transporter permease [Halorarius halobius]
MPAHAWDDGGWTVVVSPAWLTRRALFGTAAVLVLATVTFLMTTLSADPNIARLEYVASRNPSLNVTEVIADYRARRGLGKPLPVRYVDWVVSTVTLDWGRSFRFGEPVTQLVRDAGLRTAAYVLPAVGLATLLGLLSGVYRALLPDSWLGRGAVAVAYVGFSLPNFLLGELLVYYTTGTLVREPSGMQDVAIAGFQGANPAAPLGPLVATVVLPASILATSIYVSQLRFTRAQSLEYAGSEFVKLLRAKGAGPLKVGRHVLRNAAVPLVSVAFTELLAVMVVATLVIETVFNIPGLGYLVVVAVSAQDMPLLLGATTAIGLVGIGANLAQDIAYGYLDPRVGDE